MRFSDFVRPIEYNSKRYFERAEKILIQKRQDELVVS